MVNPGGPVTIDLEHGCPGKLGALVATETGGLPTARILHVGSFDPAGTIQLRSTIPAGTPAQIVRLKGFGLDLHGVKMATSEQILTIH